MEQYRDIIEAHEVLMSGRAGGCRALFRFSKLAGVILQRRNLETIQFLGCDLEGAHLALTNFRFASFYGSNLARADFRGCDLTRADLRGVRLEGASLQSAIMDGADFRRATLIEVDDRQHWKDRTAGTVMVIGQDARTVDFRDCSMRGARLNGARLQGADFGGAVLDGADLTGANLVGARFEDAVICDANFENCQLSPGALDACIREPTKAARARLPDLQARLAAHAEWVASGGQTGAKAILDGADLRVLGSCLKGARLDGASLKGCRAIGIDLSGASLVGAVLDGSDLREAVFRRADLRGCSVRNCRLTRAEFGRADLRQLEGQGGRQYSVRFDGTNLDHVSFLDARRSA